MTVADAVAAWLESKRGVVRQITFASYEFEIGYIAGPLLPSEARRATIRSGVGARPKFPPHRAAPWLAIEQNNCVREIGPGSRVDQKTLRCVLENWVFSQTCSFRVRKFVDFNWIGGAARLMTSRCQARAVARQ